MELNQVEDEVDNLAVQTVDPAGDTKSEKKQDQKQKRDGDDDDEEEEEKEEEEVGQMQGQGNVGNMVTENETLLDAASNQGTEQGGKKTQFASGSIVDTVRLLRSLNHIPYHLLPKLEERKRSVDLTQECSSRRISRAGIETNPFAFNNDGGDEALFSDDVDDKPDFLERAEKLDEGICQLRSDLNALLELSEEDTRLETRVRETIQRKDQMKKKLTSAISTVQAAQRFKLNGKKAFQRRQQERQKKAEEIHDKVVRLRALLEELDRQKRAKYIRQNILNLRERIVQANRERYNQQVPNQALTLTTDAEILEEQELEVEWLKAQIEGILLRSPVQDDHHDGKLVPVCDTLMECLGQNLPRSPLPNYWDGESRLRGLVYKSDGELCIWQGNEKGIQPKLPKRLDEKLRRRDLGLKRKRWNQLRAKLNK